MVGGCNVLKWRGSSVNTWARLWTGFCAAWPTESNSTPPSWVLRQPSTFPPALLLSPVLSPTCFPQASIYDDAGLYGSGYGSRAVSLLNVCGTRFWVFCHCRPTAAHVSFLTSFPALWTQLVLLWGQLHTQQPCGEHTKPTATLHDHANTPLMSWRLSC